MSPKVTKILKEQLAVLRELKPVTPEEGVMIGKVIGIMEAIVSPPEGDHEVLDYLEEHGLAALQLHYKEALNA